MMRCIKLSGFLDINRSPNRNQKTRPSVNSQEKKNKQKTKTDHLVDFAIPVDHRVKMKESKKRDKYLDLAKDLKNL